MHGMDHSNMTDTCSGMGMSMFFHWGLCDTLLFDEWTLSSPALLAVACILTFLISVLFEALQTLEIRLENLAVEAILHLGNSILGYGVMLVVMSYHAGLFLAAVLGRSVGYFFFAWSRPPGVIVNVDCCE